jgi:hypothetical protein
MIGVALMAIPALTVIVCWLGYLVFCLKLVGKTGDSKSLLHAAAAVRAVRTSSGGFLSTLTKIVRRG